MSKSTEPRGQGIVKDDRTLDKKQRLVEYVEPVVALMREGRAHNVAGRLEERSVQAVIARLENRIAVCELLMRAWYPYRYEVVAVEELNAIAAGHDRKVRNIDRAVENGEFFAVDMSNVDTVRARSGFGEYDDAALVRFLEENIEYDGGKVIVVLDRRLKLIERLFPGFSWFAREHGIEVFDKGNYRRFGGKA